MDIFSHGLWVGAAFEVLNLKFKKSFKVGWTVFWGVFPDVFAFAPLFVWMLGSAIFGGVSFGEFPGPERMEPAAHDTFWFFRLASVLYGMSHSLIIFLIVFFLVCLILKNRSLVLGGWLLHILIDIFTHSYKFYPTPFLWPISSWKFDGLSWAAPWFIITNYLALTIVYLLLYIINKKFQLKKYEAKQQEAKQQEAKLY